MYFRLNLTREYDVLSNHSNEYYGIGLDAHILASFRNSVSLFVRTLDKPFFLDPVFYKFSQPYYRNNAEKRWAEVLREEYGLGMILQEHEDGISPDILTQDNISNITDSVLTYQRKSGSEAANEAVSLLELVGMAAYDERIAPEFLIPPYFIYGDDGNVKTVNLHFLDEALRIRERNEKVYAPIVFDPDFLLDTTFIDNIVNEYSSRNVDGFVIWLTDLKESDVDGITLEYFVKFLKKLKAAAPEKEIIDLYGGYYSLILSTHGILDGVLQGVGISESKNPEQIGGGGRPRFYVPIARQMVSTDLAADLIGTNRSVFYCGCPGCLANYDIIHKRTRELDEHFMYNRINEVAYLETLDIPGVINNLEEDCSKLINVVEPTAQGFAFRTERRLAIWINALNEI